MAGTLCANVDAGVDQTVAVERGKTAASVAGVTAAGVSVDGDKTLELRLWQVDALAFSVAETVDLLLAMARRDDVGRDLRLWHKAVIEALAFVSGQQVIPALERDDFHWRAYWQILSSQTERISTLAAHMSAL